MLDRCKLFSVNGIELSCDRLDKTDEQFSLTVEQAFDNLSYSDNCVWNLAVSKNRIMNCKPCLLSN